MTWLVWVKDNKFKFEFCTCDDKITPYIAVNVNVNYYACCWWTLLIKKSKWRDWTLMKNVFEQRACNPLKSGKHLKHINWHCVKHDLLAGNIGHLLVMANMWMSQEFSRELWS